MLGSDFEVASISAQEIREGISRLHSIHHNGLAFVSLDRICCCKEMPVFEINRLVGKDFKDIGVANRPGSVSTSEQFEALKQVLPPDCRRIGVVDDGCFTAGTLNKFVSQAKEHSLAVEAILMGVVIHGEELPWGECDIHYTHYFHPGQVLDWVWDRDFYPGVPLSGRTVGRIEDGHPCPLEPSQGASYLRGFGEMGKWASIPEDGQLDLTKFCLKQSIGMFQEVELLSSRAVRMVNLDRWPYGIRFKRLERIADVLNREASLL